MKIGIISNLYPPHERGGAELIARRVADELAKRGHTVSVLTTQPFLGWKSLKLSLQENHAERVYRFHPLNLFGVEDTSKKPFVWRLMWHLIDAVSPGVRSVIQRWILEEQPDFIFTHNLKGIGLSIGRFIQDAQIPHIHTIHDIQLTVPSGLMLFGQEDAFLNTSFLRTWYERLTKYAIGNPDLVISPSKFLLNLHMTRGFFLKKKTVVLSNPAPSMTVPNPSEVSSKTLRLLFAGQLETHKGILFLLEVLNQLEIPFELHIAGDGSLRAEMEERCLKDKRLIFHGFVALNPLLQLMTLVDAVVVPSLCYENSPTVIYESFAVGTPVIASHLGGIPELIVEGENGYTFEPGNEKQFVSILQKMYQEKDVWRSKTRIIRSGAEKYALKKYVDELEKLISEKK